MLLLLLLQLHAVKLLRICSQPSLKHGVWLEFRLIWVLLLRTICGLVGTCSKRIDCSALVHSRLLSHLGPGITARTTREVEHIRLIWIRHPLTLSKGSTRNTLRSAAEKVHACIAVLCLVVLLRHAGSAKEVHQITTAVLRCT